MARSPSIGNCARTSVIPRHTMSGDPWRRSPEPLVLVAMRRTLGGRAFALFVGAWLAFSMTEPAGLHACPVHSAPFATGSSAHATPLHRQDHAAGHGEHGPAHRGGSQHQCTCLSKCCCAAVAVLPALGVTLEVPVTSALRDTGLPDYSYVRVASEHILPFQNGPPTRA